MRSPFSRMAAACKANPRLTAVLGVAVALACWYGGWYALARYRLTQAERLVARRDFEAAAAQIDAADKAWSGDAATILWSARISRLRKQPTEAFRLLDRALAQGADVERIVLERYLLRAERGELPEVEKKLLAYLAKEHPDAVYILDTLTWQWMMTHRFGDALRSLEQWLKLRPTDREAMVRRAWTLERIRDLAGALTAYEEALALDPERDRADNDRIRMRLAELLIDRFRPKDAIGHYEILAERHPGNSDVQLGLARCRLQLGETEQGLKTLETLLQAHPTHAKAMGEMGKTLVQMERLNEAEPWLRKASQALPSDRAITFSFEQCLEKLGKKDEAKALRRRLDRIRADEQAVASLMKDVQVSPRDPALRQRIGEIFLRNQLVDDGLLWLGSALFYDGDYAPAHEVLAEWFESQGNMAKAAPHRAALERLGVAKAGNRFTASGASGPGS